MRSLISLVCLMSLSIAAFAQNRRQSITNQDILDMVKEKFSSELIIKNIQTAESVNFDTSTQELTRLKKSGVKEKIIMAMMERARVNQVTDVNTKTMVEDKPSSEKAPDTYYIDKDGNFGKVEQTKTPDTKSAPPGKPQKMRVKAKSFTFELDGCRLSGDVITCDVMVTSNTDIQLSYSYASSIVDDQGHEFRAAQKSIGGNSNSEPLSANVTVIATLVFEGIQKPPKIVKLLRLSLYTPTVSGGKRIPGGGNFKVEFKDIPLAQ